MRFASTTRTDHERDLVEHDHRRGEREHADRREVRRDHRGRDDDADVDEPPVRPQLRVRDDPEVHEVEHDDGRLERDPEAEQEPLDDLEHVLGRRDAGP